MSDKPYRPCVGLAVFNPAGEVFVGQRIDTPGAWQMPQGGIDPGEDLEKAALRELYEETGIRSVKIRHIFEKPITYDLPHELNETLWGGKFRGQIQTWIALEFTGTDDEINLRAHTPPEFSAWQWMDLRKTIDHIVPFKREAYKEIVALLSGIIKD